MAGGRLTPKLAKWRRWLAIVRSDLDSLVVRRTTHGAARAALREAADPVLTTYLDELRSQSVALCIRRQLKIDSKSINLAGLIRDAASVLGGGRARASAGRSPEPSHGSCITLESWVAALEAELARLEALALPVQRYADRRLAHADKRPEAPAPPLARLEGVLDDLETLWRHAAQLVDAVDAQTGGGNG